MGQMFFKAYLQRPKDTPEDDKHGLKAVFII